MIDLKSLGPDDGLQQLVDLVEQNNKMIAWLLENLTSDNITSIDTSRTKISSGNGLLEINDDSIVVRNSSGTIVAKLSPTGNVV